MQATASIKWDDKALREILVIGIDEQGNFLDALLFSAMRHPKRIQR